MLAVAPDAYAAMVGHAYDAYPEEMCGLLAGDAARGTGVVFYPCRNVARSSRIFEIHGMDYQRAEEDADRRGLELVAVVHSHTHTEPYPSPTDVGVADGLGPWFRWVIVGLKRESPETRSYRIVEREVTEERLAVG